MASSDDNSLKKYFNNAFKKETRARSSENIIEWFQQMDAFKALKILESDFRKACGKLKEKAIITFEDFLQMLREFAEQNNIDLGDLKSQLVTQMSTFEQAQIVFREKLQKGKASIDDAMDWLRINHVFEKAKLVEDEVQQALNKAKETANTVDYNKFISGLKEAAANKNIDIDKVVNKILNPGLLPLSEEDSSDSEDGNVDTQRDVADDRRTK